MNVLVLPGIFLASCLPGAGPPGVSALDIVNASAGLPVEYHADVVFRLQDRLRAEDPKEWEQALTQVIGLAETAKAATRVRLSRWAPGGGGEEVQQHGASAGLDRLSIKIRAIESLAGQDAARAVELAEQMSPPRLRPSPCGSALVEVDDHYFEFLGRLGRAALGDRAKDRPLRNRYLRLIENTLNGIGSPTELAPAARLLAELPLSPEEWRRAVMFLAGRMRTMLGGDREFVYSFASQTLTANLGKLLEQAPAQKGDDVRPVLLSAFVRYATQHLAQPECEAFPPPLRLSEQMRAKEPKPPAEQVNSLIGAYASTGVTPIDVSSLRPRPRAGKANVSRPEAPVRVGDLIVEISPYRPGALDPRSEEWRRKAEECLKLIREMRAGDGDCPECTAFHRVGYLTALLDTAKDSALYEAIAEEVVRSFEDPYAQREWRGAWVYSFEQVLNLTRTVAPEQSDFVAKLRRDAPGPLVGPHAQGSKLLNLMCASHDRLVALYGQMEAAFPRPYDLWWTKSR